MKVLEIGGYAAGYCGRLFARGGAEVLRAECAPPQPAWVSQRAMHLFLHPRKQMLEADATELAALAAQVDLLVCEADTADALAALGYHQWRTPLKVAITPFGLTGPKRNWRATSNVLLAMAGHTHLVGAPEREPLTVMGHYLDFQTGALAYAAANAHRIAKISTNIDISALETAATHHHWTQARLHTSGDIRSRHDSDYWYCAPAHLYPCKDGHVCTLVNANFWEPFALMLGQPELIVDERFGTNRRRMENREALHKIVKSKFSQYTRDELECLAVEFRLPLAGLRCEQEVLDDAHLAARNFWERPAQEVAELSGPGPLIPSSAVRLTDAATGSGNNPDNGAETPSRPAHQLVGPRERRGVAPLGPVHRRESPAQPKTARGERGQAEAMPRATAELSGLESPVQGPLQGIRVLDLTHVWAGPLAARYLGDFGATVVKVEAARSRGSRDMSDPPVGGWLGEDAGREPWNRDAGWISLHRNRFGLCLDLKSGRGREIFLQLVAVSDVVVENFSAQTMAKLGLSYATLAAANPAIIHVAMPGYGGDGPYRNRVAFGSVVESQAGMNARLGYARDHPVNTTQALPDPISAHHALCAIIDAIHTRTKRGLGARIEVSLYEAGVVVNGPALIDHQLDGPSERHINRHPNLAPHGIYRCAGEDQWLALACVNDRQWQSLCALLRNGLETLDYPTRRARQDAIDTQINQWTQCLAKTEAAAILQDAGIPAGPVYNAPEMEADEQLGFRRFFAFTDRFDLPMQGNPVHTETLGRIWQPAPRLGEHNSAILSAWLGYSEAQISDLRCAGVIATEPT